MNDIIQIANPISGEIATRPAAASAMANSDQQRAIAEVQAAMVIARANPRNQVQAVDRILTACQRKGLAERAIYAYARGGSDIQGPSIRLAEVIAQGWGNMQFGLREMERRVGESEVQAFAWDLETNVRREVAFTVPHVRETRSGNKALKDPRDIYELFANMGQRRVRSCILAVVPGDIVEAAVEQCEQTMRANADTSPEAMQNMVAEFQKFGVSQMQIEARIQRRLSAIQPAHVVAMKKIYMSLRDGLSTPDQWFETEDAGTGETKTGNAAAKDALKKATTEDKPDPRGMTEVSEETARALDAAQGGVGEAQQEDSRPAVDHYGPRPADPGHGESWYDPDSADQRIRYAHLTDSHGVKWYLQPPPEIEGDGTAPPAWQPAVDKVRELIAAARDRKGLNAADSEFVKIAAGLPDEIKNTLEGELSHARQKLAPKKD